MIENKWQGHNAKWKFWIIDIFFIWNCLIVSDNRLKQYFYAAVSYSLIIQKLLVILQGWCNFNWFILIHDNSSNLCFGNTSHATLSTFAEKCEDFLSLPACCWWISCKIQKRWNGMGWDRMGGLHFRKI